MKTLQHFIRELIADINWPQMGFEFELTQAI